jgi:hypothetical protein
VRIGALRVWITNAVHQSAVAARRIGTMVARKIRAATGAIEAGVGVGDDESAFGGRGNRAWIQEIIDDARKRILAFLEKSFFERFPRFQRAMRKLLGTAAHIEAPQPMRKTAGGPVKLGAHTPDASAAEAYRRQIQQGMREAHTREHAGLRDRIEKGKKG